MKKIVIFIILLVFTGLTVMATVYISRNSERVLQANVVFINDTAEAGIARSQLALHNSEADCWVAYKQEVFDLTDWLQKHPGGVDAILPACGTKEKFEEMFTKQHGTSKVQFLVKVGELMGMLKYEGQLSQ